MLSPYLLARVDSYLRPWLIHFPSTAVTLYSYTRPQFLEALVQVPEHSPRWQPPRGLERRLWGLRFRSPVGNAAGMFKNGDGFELVAAQGAGWYLAGTTTATPRRGNSRCGVKMPFAPYPRSGAASNWLGLPNAGHRAVARRLDGLRVPAGAIEGCPIGASLAADSAETDEERMSALQALVEGLEAYRDAGVDFLEINESCPNTQEGRPGTSELAERLTFLQEHFLSRREQSLPVIVKFSCDTPPEQVPALLDLLLELGFDGVNFGNTSTDYTGLRSAIRATERRAFDFFSRRFGGGVSGRPLRSLSLRLVEAAAEHLARRPPGREFHIVRTGGIEHARDILESEAAGAALCQWYTGYFEALARHGHGVYRELYSELLEERSRENASSGGVEGVSTAGDP